MSGLRGPDGPLGAPERAGDEAGGGGRVAPGEVVALLEQGIALHRAGRLEEASQRYKNALSRDPANADALHLLGVIAFQTNQPAEAIRLIERAIAVDAGKSVYWRNLGLALRADGRLEAAIAACRRGLAIKPDDADGLSNLAMIQKGRGYLTEAAELLQRALEIRPDDPNLLLNLGVLRRRQGQPEAAIGAYRRVIDLKPDYAEAHFNLGIAFDMQLHWVESVAAYERALALRPSYFEAQACLLHPLQQLCAWDRMAELTPGVDAEIRRIVTLGKQSPEATFAHLARSDDASLNRLVARSWADDVRRAMLEAPRPASSPVGRASDRIRLGYLSGDFRDHPVAQLVVGLLREHDRSAFDVFAYSYGPDDGSRYRSAISRSCTAFVDVADLDHPAAAQRIADDGIDILVDLAGWTTNCRLEICALKPAPVQVAYLGYPGTTGAGFIDYLIADRIVIPPDQLDSYTEKIVHLPDCFQVNDREQPISPRRFERRDFGLPDAAFIFCCFSQSYKIDPLMFAAWMRLLRTVDHAVLWLASANETARANLVRVAEGSGVAGDRLIFARRLPDKADHLARLQLADLALDTRVFNGHTTTSDMLWAGVPVVTLMGRHFASRVSASLLGAVGLGNLVARTLIDYEALALELAEDPARLRGLRERLGANRLTMPLFDTPRFARNIERAYRMMWKIHESGASPRPIVVPTCRD